ncbi:hypothetical protein [Vibrio sp. 99-70-13A1]|uniref:hypothetical protein n=1 Tax=Vibrio sp. 99-70-13A1 TaxID=2607601 RepID=UPI00149398B0|nr:hypothetical protein [Vibrio sp. 99-70-13A1]NOH96272.1 hypothetical protein [Vibrio sp. 99-70-13A1]
MDKPDNTELEAENQAVHTVAANDDNYNAAFDDLDAMDKQTQGTEAANDDEAEPPVDSAAVVGMVGMGLFMSEQFISGSAGVEFTFDEKAKEKFLESSGPLIEKYGLTWLTWFENYKEEIMFGVAAVGLGYSGINSIKRLQALQEKEAANDAETEKAAA